MFQRKILDLSKGDNVQRALSILMSSEDDESDHLSEDEHPLVDDVSHTNTMLDQIQKSFSQEDLIAILSGK